MHEKVMEILVYLMKHMQDEQGRFNDISTVSQALVGNGYTQHEVNTAFTWLFERLQAQSEELVSTAPPLRPRPNRVLHTIERLVISPEAYGYIIQLRELGLIDDIQTEMVIERAMLTGARYVTPSDIKTITASILLDFESAEWSHQGPPWYDSDEHLAVN